MNRNWAMASIFLAVLTTTALVVAQDPAATLPEKPHHSRYRLLDLGTFGGPQSYAPDGLDITVTKLLNNRGQVVGWADTSSADPFPDFCWDDDCFVGHAFAGGPNGKKDLGVLPGGSSSDSTWIAENGLISGDSENGELDPLVPGFPEIRAVLWRSGQIIDLGTLDGGYESFTTSVNSRGQVVGLATNGLADPNSMFGLGYQTRAFVWEHGAMQDLGTLGSGTDAAAGLINERGQVVGWSYTDSNPSDTCAFVYGFPLSTGSFLWENGKGMVDLGGLGGSCTSQLVSTIEDKSWVNHGRLEMSSDMPSVGTAGTDSSIWARWAAAISPARTRSTITVRPSAGPRCPPTTFKFMPPSGKETPQSIWAPSTLMSAPMRSRLTQSDKWLGFPEPQTVNRSVLSCGRAVAPWSK